MRSTTVAVTRTGRPPNWLFYQLNEEFHFTVDLAATSLNAKHWRYITPAQDALTVDWREAVYLSDCSSPCSGWLNPPYGREIGKWVKKARLSATPKTQIVCLLPARTDTTWWHADVRLADEIRFLKGRLRFSGQPNGAPFPSAIVVFSSHPRMEVWKDYTPSIRFVDYKESG